MIVNVISESVSAPEKWGGIHTAFLTHIEMLKERGVTVLINSSKKADIVHIHTLGPLGMYRLFSNKNTVLSTHITVESFLNSWKGANIVAPAINKYLNIAYKRADLVVALNEHVKKELKQIGVKRIAVIPNPINTKVFHFDGLKRNEGKKNFGISENAFIALGVGKFIPRKGFYDFLEIAQNLPHITFLWLGGHDIKMLNVQTEKQKNLYENRPKNVILPGIVSYEKVIQFYNMADIFLFPSYQEIASMVILEAAACGLPLVLRNNEEYKSLYGDMYLASNSISDFTKLVDKLYTDKTYFKKRKEKSVELTKQFSFQTISNALLREYNELL